MNAVSGFILLSLIANCQFRPVTEFDVDFQVIEQIQESYRHCPINCQEANDSKCQCLDFPHAMNCTGQVIEHGLRKLNLVCDVSDTGTYKICRILERLRKLENTDQALCGSLSPNHILNYIRRVYQRSNSIETAMRKTQG